MSQNRANTKDNIAQCTKHSVSKPPKYKVIMINDNYTTMDFVVEVLEVIFHLSAPMANAIMLDIHNKGEGVAGIYHKEIAETKVAQVMAAAYRGGFPLQCRLEKE